MKKVLSIVLLVFIALGICACGNGNGGKNKTIKMNESTETGSLEYTIQKVEFAKNISCSVSDGYQTLDDENVFGIVTYSIRNISKEGISIWNEQDRGYIAVGKFVYGDGYNYENSFYSNRPRVTHYDEISNSLRRGREGVLEPLTSEDDCILFIILPKDIVENTDEKLFYEISFSDIGDDVKLRYEVTDREIKESFPSN